MQVAIETLMSRYGGVQIGEIEDLGSFVQRYLFPVQSLAQGLCFLGVLAGVVLILFALERFEGYRHFSIFEWLLTALAATAGGLPSLIVALPARFVIRAATTTERAAIREFLLDGAARLGYGGSASVGPETVLKKVQRKWLSWPGSTVRLAELDDGIEVRGPKILMSILRKRASAAFRA